MTQPVGRADRADNRDTDQVAQDGAVERLDQPGAHTQQPLETERLWALFQVDQQRISALDTIMMTIRGWTVTLVSALVGFSLTQHHRNLLLVAIVGAALFGLLDVGYRRVQLLDVDRARKVEQVIAPDYRLRPQSPGRPRRLTSLLGGNGIQLVDLVLRCGTFPLVAPLDSDLRFAGRLSDLASGLALAVRPAGLAEVSGAQGWVLKIVSAERFETIFGCP
jgi:hypothetical protein